MPALSELSVPLRERLHTSKLEVDRAQRAYNSAILAIAEAIVGLSIGTIFVCLGCSTEYVVSLVWGQERLHDGYIVCGFTAYERGNPGHQRVFSQEWLTHIKVTERPALSRSLTPA